MAPAAKLVNPTPWDAKINWDRGIVIRIPAFGEANLTMQQMDDFRSDKPGSEAVRETLNHYGLFLLDTDRPYDNQALEALRRCHKAKKDQYDGVVSRMKESHAAAGMTLNEDVFKEKLTIMGYGNTEEHLKQLSTQIRKYESIVKETGDRATREQFDPTRTILVTDPPREFPSVAAMEFFLSLPENKEIRLSHEAYTKRLAEAASIKPATASNVGGQNASV